MRCLVTGASGHLGSYLTRLLLSRGHEVIVFVRPQSDLWRIADVLSQTKLIRGDLSDIDRVMSEITSAAPGETYTIRSIAERIRDMIDPELPLGLGEVPYRPDQVMHLQADISKLQRTTGWKPAIKIDEGLRRTVEWFRNETLHIYPNL